MSASARPFDRFAQRRRRERAAPHMDAHGFLFAEVARRLVERLEGVGRDFPCAIDIGCRTGFLARALAASSRTERPFQCDGAFAGATRAGAGALVADTEALPFAPASADLVLTSLELQGVNDVPGVLLQIRDTLKPDGLFLGAMLGGSTLTELRQAFLAAESTLEGGASPRVAPFVRLVDAAALLQRAGFALPVADAETIAVTYADPRVLLADLRGMGETNALTQRRRSPLRRATLAAALTAYRERFATPEGRVGATFEVIFLSGWRPGPGQPRAARRGSGRIGLAQAVTERPPGTPREDP